MNRIEADHHILGSLTASGGGIRQVRAGQDIGGDVTAYDGIGYLPGELPPWKCSCSYESIVSPIEAGRDITGDLTAQRGNIEWVVEYSDYLPMSWVTGDLFRARP
ncbi:MAG TPA: hypothetical protein VNK04_14695 [Gemmataceae bacterium]|nr:hypothetical protein [Gemmataceae bacterium]